MRTGKIGPRAFLFERPVPDVMTPVCACGDECGSILPAGGDNQTGVVVRDAHAPRFQHGGKDPTRAASLTRWEEEREAEGKGEERRKWDRQTGSTRPSRLPPGRWHHYRVFAICDLEGHSVSSHSLPPHEPSLLPPFFPPSSSPPPFSLLLSGEDLG